MAKAVRPDVDGETKKATKKRRGRGEVHCDKQPSGKWKARTTHHGKRIARSGNSKPHALENLRKALGEIDAGTLTKPTTITVGEWVNRWIDEVGAKELGSSTIQEYKRAIRLHIAPQIGHVRLSKLTAAVVDGFYRSLDETPSAGIRCHKVLNPACDRAVDLSLLSINPCKRAKQCKLPKREATIWTLDEGKRFLEVAEDNPLFAFYLLGVCCGMRISEIIALKWSAVDLDAGKIEVTSSSRELTGRREFVSPKTRSSRRTILPAAFVIDALRDRQRDSLREGHAGVEWVFPMRHGGPLTRRNMLGRFHALCRKAGVPKIRFHDTRHIAISVLIDKGVPLLQIAEMVGHKDTRIIQDTYGHLLPGIHEKAAAVMDSVFGGKVKGPKLA